MFNGLKTTSDKKNAIAYAEICVIAYNRHH